MNKNKLNKCHYNRFQHLIVMTAILQFHDTILSVIVAGNGLTEKKNCYIYSGKYGIHNS